MTICNVKKECRRDRLRLRYLALVELKTGNRDVISGGLRDIGLNSLYFKIEDYQESKVPELDDSVEVDISVMSGKSKLTISSPGCVVRRDEGGIAIKFVDPLKWWPIFSFFPVNEQFMFDIVA